MIQKMKKGVMKKGQVTIFIVVAIVIVAAGLLIYFFYPKLQTSLGYDSSNPSDYLQQCLEEEIEEAIEVISPKGGAIDPDLHYLYKGEKIRYLCYTGEYYATCVMQEAFLQGTIENEISEYIKKKSQECLSDLEDSFERKGYSVDLDKGSFNIELLPKRVVASVNGSVSITKAGETQTYSTMNVIVNNNLYEFVAIVNSILNWEARYGDAETTLYMTYYRDLKVEKLKQTEGTTIYILTDRNTEDKFQFASRSVAWPAGYSK